MVDKVIIKNLHARGIIGINDWEREKEQDILINIEVFTHLEKAGLSDDISDSVNYRTIAKEAIRCAETTNRFTVEALAADIAKFCLSQTLVEGVRVRVEKPGAVRFSESVGVEIERTRASQKQ
jgi:FolB domain-containing protein